MSEAKDPRRVLESKDMEGAVLYAKRISNDASDAWPLLANADGSLIVNITGGTISLSSTKVTIESASGLNVNVATATLGTVTVSLTSTKVTIDNTVTVSLSPTTVTVAGTVSLSATASTVNNASGAAAVNIQDGGNAITVDGSVSLTSTKVTVEAATAIPISGSVNIATATLGTVTVSGNVNIATATLGTVTIAGTVTLSTTASTINNAAANPVNVSLTSTAVTVAGSVSLTSTAVSVTNSVSTIAIVGRTLTGSTGSLSATNGSITVTPTNRIKVYAISLTTTSATELICILNSGGVANGLELWRATLMAPAGANAGLNLAVDPPNFLFASRSGTSVSLSLNTATLVHYSVSYFDEV